MLFYVTLVLLRAAFTMKREAEEGELCQENEIAQPSCGVLRVVDTPEWKLQKEQHEDMRPTLCWQEAQRRPNWGDTVGCSLVTKGLQS